MPDPTQLVLIAAVFVLGGAVKGVIGLGLPTVVLILLTATLGLTEAMALMLVPAIVTNIWQALQGGHLRAILLRFKWLLLLVCIGTWFGSYALVSPLVSLLPGLLGLLVLVYGALGLMKLHPVTPARWEPRLSPGVGLVNGVLTGMTGAFVVPATLYMQSVGLSRDVLIQAMGVLYLISSTALTAAMAGRGLFAPDVGWLSIAAVVPSLLGMALGQKVRRGLSEARFRTVFFAALCLLGAYLVGNTVLQPGL